MVELKYDLVQSQHIEQGLPAQQLTLSMHILVINAGSSSIKFALFDMAAETLQLSGNIERIGETKGTAVLRHHGNNGRAHEESDNAEFPNHAAALRRISNFLCTYVSPSQSLTAIAHRVVHGGEYFPAATFIDSAVIDKIRATVPLAPLHNPANLAGIEALRDLYPQVPQIAVFDTAFFQTLPPRAYRYAVPQQWYRDYHVRRYGFHGTSHQYVANVAAAYLQQPLNQLRLVSLHLGNGASAAAIHYGNCIDTSMGMTPLEGLVMGTRCGDIDPALPFYLTRHSGMDLDEIEIMLNQHSGVRGLCGARDMREVHRLADAGNEHAALAIDLYCYRISKYIGAYHIALGGIDALLFTGGIGENDAAIRRLVCSQLAVLDVEIDDQINEKCHSDVGEISTADSNVKVLVVTTNEELEIARQTLQHISRHSQPAASEEAPS